MTDKQKTSKKIEQAIVLCDLQTETDRLSHLFLNFPEPTNDKLKVFKKLSKASQLIFEARIILHKEKN